MTHSNPPGDTTDYYQLSLDGTILNYRLSLDGSQQISQQMDVPPPYPADCYPLANNTFNQDLNHGNRHNNNNHHQSLGGAIQNNELSMDNSQPMSEHIEVPPPPYPVDSIPVANNTHTSGLYHHHSNNNISENNNIHQPGGTTRQNYQLSLDGSQQISQQIEDPPPYSDLLPADNTNNTPTEAYHQDYHHHQNPQSGASNNSNHLQ